MLLLQVAYVLVFAIPQLLSKDTDAAYELRGRYKASEDGKTYLVIEDNNGGKCGPLIVDGNKWAHGLNQKGEVQPGNHSIECGAANGIFVKEGTIYYFDYWGP